MTALGLYGAAVMERADEVNLEGFGTLACQRLLTCHVIGGSILSIFCYKNFIVHHL